MTAKIEILIVNQVSRLKRLLLFITVYIGTHKKRNEAKRFVSTETKIIMDDKILHILMVNTC